MPAGRFILSIFAALIFRMFHTNELNAYRILRVLAGLRLAAVILQAGAVVVINVVFGWRLPLAAMLAVPVALLAWNLGVCGFGVAAGTAVGRTAG